MKKLTILVALAMVMAFAGTAYANTIIIPFFNDSGSLAGETPDAMRTFIRVKSLEMASTIVCSIFYTGTAGEDATPSPNTFVLGPLATVGFRPVRDDTAAEGAAGNAVPDAEPVGSFIVANGGVGGAVIMSAGEIVGMVSEENWFVGGGSGLAPAVQ